MKLLERAFQAHKYELLKKINVVGVGIGYKFKNNQKTKSLGIITLVTQKLPLASLTSHDFIPPSIKGLATDVWETGPLKIFQKRQELMRPAAPGSSIGHYQCPGAGTFGAIVKDVKGTQLILSNNHILANLTNGRDGRSKVGDAILQPAVLDGGVEKDRIAFLKTYLPVNYNNSEKNPQYLDVALAQPDNPAAVRNRILNIGLVNSYGEPELGQVVFKSGRSSGLTVGEIIAKKVMLTISYGDQLDVEAVYDDQILASTGGLPGDSGSLLVTTDGRKGVGLLLGGGSGIDVYNPMPRVIEQLRVTF